MLLQLQVCLGGCNVVMRSLSGIRVAADSISKNLKQLTELGLIGSAMASGMKPVYRITTSKTLSDGMVTDGYIANTIPDWVDVKSLGDENPHLGFDRETLKSILKYKVDTVLGDQITDNAVVGILMDESPKNIYRHLVDIIFTNVPYQSKDGIRKMLAEDFIFLGFPIQLSMGFIDIDGNFRKHPNEPPISTYGEVPPDFTGLLGALTQETFSQGDFFQGTFVGFEYLLSRFAPQDPFPIKSGEPVTRTLARILRWLAIKSSEYTKVTTRSATAGDATIAIPILRAMGVMDQNDTRVLSTEEIRKNIVLVDMPRYGKITRNTIPRFTSGKFIMSGTNVSYAELIKEVIEKLTNTEIFFNEYGRLTVSGKPKVREIAAKSYDRIRVHDAIIGNNVVHHQATVDLSQIVNRIIIHKVFSGINAGSPTMSIVRPNIGVMLEEDDVTKYYGHNEEFDIRHVYHYDDIGGDETDSISVEEQIIDYFRYYGMRGTVFMTGNPKIRVNDVVRISDIRSFGIPGMNNPQAVLNLSKEIEYTIDNTMRDTNDDRLIEKSFRLKTGIDHFHIWKVIHYLGSDGFKSKVFYTKEQDSYRPGSDLLGQHIRRRKRGIVGDTR